MRIKLGSCTHTAIDGNPLLAGQCGTAQKPFGRHSGRSDQSSSLLFQAEQLLWRLFGEQAPCSCPKVPDHCNCRF